MIVIERPSQFCFGSKVTFRRSSHELKQNNRSVTPKRARQACEHVLFVAFHVDLEQVDASNPKFCDGPVCVPDFNSDILRVVQRPIQGPGTAVAGEAGTKLGGAVLTSERTAAHFHIVKPIQSEVLFESSSNFAIGFKGNNKVSAGRHEQAMLSHIRSNIDKGQVPPLIPQDLCCTSKKIQFRGSK
jgi:hypothetical protein